MLDGDRRIDRGREGERKRESERVREKVFFFIDPFDKLIYRWIVLTGTPETYASMLQ